MSKQRDLIRVTFIISGMEFTETLEAKTDVGFGFASAWPTMIDQVTTKMFPKIIDAIKKER